MPLWDSKERIFYGNEAQPNAYPWIALLLRDEDTRAESDHLNSACSAVLIGNRFALTAAHCLYTQDNDEALPASEFSIILGVHNRTKRTEPKRKQIRIKDIFVHEKFNSSLNDIALLKLEERVDLSIYPPACLPFNFGENLVGQNGHVYGWGDSGTETSTDVL